MRSVDGMFLRISMLLLLLSAPFGSYAQSRATAVSSLGNANLTRLWPKSDPLTSQGRDAKASTYLEARAGVTGNGGGAGMSATGSPLTGLRGVVTSAYPLSTSR
jgi:hypothetical protein